MGSVSEAEVAAERARTPTEEIVARIWATELRLPSIGLDEDFIDLGSHSLQGVAVVARLEERFGVSIPVRVLFEEPTVADLAAWIDRHRGDSDGPQAEIVRLQEGSGLRPVFAVPGFWADDLAMFALAKVARTTDSHRPVYGFPGTPPVPANTPENEWVEAAAASLNAAVRLRQRHGPYLLFGGCIGGIIAWEMARQLEASDEIAHLFLVDTQHPRLRANAEARPRTVAQTQSRIEKRMQRLAKTSWEKLPRASAPSDVEETMHRMIGNRDLRAEMTRAYRPKPLVGRVRLIANARWHCSHPTLGWDSLVGDRLDVAVMGGESHGLLENLQEIAIWLRAGLDDVDPQPRAQELGAGGAPTSTI
jgi:thioesterase domain-containing protein/acyl carrier protein